MDIFFKTEKQRVDIVVSESLRKFFANVLSIVKTVPEVDSKMSESLASELQDEKRNQTNE